MPLPESGRITIDEICDEFSVEKSSVDLSNDLGPLIGIEAGEKVRLTDFYGASGSATPGSVFRRGSTNQFSIGNRIIMKSTQEPTTDMRLGNGNTFTVNFWVKAGWTPALSSYGKNQFLIGWGGNAVHPNYQSNVYNQIWRCWYDESLNRLWTGFLGDDANGNPRYTQNFWFFHKNSGTPNISTVSGLGTSYWTNQNRGNTNDNDFTMITITVNNNFNSGNVKLWWNGNYVGTPFYSTASNNGTPLNDTDVARGMLLLGAPYSQNNSTYGGTLDEKSGYLGGNGDTYVDEVSIWDSVLSSSDLASLYNSGDGGSISTSTQPEGLIAYWNFDSTSQDTTNKTVLPIWPNPSTNSNKGKIEIDGNSGFGSGTNTINGT